MCLLDNYLTVGGEGMSPQGGITGSNICLAQYADKKPNITSPVRWTHSMENLLKSGVDEFYEVGPGKVLNGLLWRIGPNKRVKNIETVRSLDAVLSQ